MGVIWPLVTQSEKV